MTVIETNINLRSKAMGILLLMAVGTVAVTYAQIASEGAPASSAPPSLQRGQIVAADGELLAMTQVAKPGTYQQRATRLYPNKTLAAQVLGVMGQSDGIEGLELAYNEELSRGEHLQLTLDVSLQAAAEAALQERVIKHKADYGSVVVVETRTGRLLSVATYPTFDPGQWRSATQEQRRNRAFLDQFEPGSIIKGLVVASALDDGLITPKTRFDTPMRRFVGGRWGSTIGDSVDHGPVLDTQGVLRFSSNVGMSHIVEPMTNQQLRDHLRLYGFGERIAPEALGLPASRGALQPLPVWNDLVRTTNSFGQGMSTTTLQAAMAYNALANGGVYIPPRLVEPLSEEAVAALKRRLPASDPIKSAVISSSAPDPSQAPDARAIKLALAEAQRVDREAAQAAEAAKAAPAAAPGGAASGDAPVTEEDPTRILARGSALPARLPPVRRVMSEKTNGEIRSLLRMVIEQGIPHAAMIRGYQLGGKTGTAQVVVDGRYSPDIYESTFAGFFPAERPEITVLVMAHGAKIEHHGSQLAAPVFKQIVGAYISQRGIVPNEALSEEQDKIQELRRKGAFSR